jgi:3'-5' exoribonuclease
MSDPGLSDTAAMRARLQQRRSAAAPPNFRATMDQQSMLGPSAPLEASQPPPACPEHRSLASLADGDRVEGHYVIRDRSRRPTKKGGEWLALKLSDRSATLSAKAFDDVGRLFEAAVPGTIVQVRGRFEASAQWGNSVIVDAIDPAADGGYDASALLETSPVPLERLEGDLRALLDTIRTPDLVELLDRFFAPGTAVYERFRDAPAAKHYHQAYRHGLLEHALTVAQSVSAAASFFPGIDRDVAVTGALLHDIGKLEAYNDDPLAIDLTDLGRLHGEIPLGYYRVRSEIERIDGFDGGIARAVLHIILSHHGSLEHGSPVVPCTREATLVHMMDNLGGKLGSFDRVERSLQDGEAWSGFDRGIGGGAYFHGREAGTRGEEAA